MHGIQQQTPDRRSNARWPKAVLFILCVAVCAAIGGAICVFYPWFDDDNRLADMARDTMQNVQQRLFAGMILGGIGGLIFWWRTSGSSDTDSIRDADA